MLRAAIAPYPHVALAVSCRDTYKDLVLEGAEDSHYVCRPHPGFAEREVEAAKARVALEQASSRTDLNPYAGYKRVANDNTVLLGVSVPLKIRDRNEAGISRARTDLKTAETQMRIIQNRVLADVQMAYEAFQTSVAQAQTFRNEILNQADESRSIALAAYQEGATALLPVLEAQRTRAEVRQQYFRTLFDYQTSLIDLELAVGKEIQP